MNRYVFWYLAVSFVLTAFVAGWLGWEDLVDRRKGRPRDHKFGYHFGGVHPWAGQGVGWLIVCAFAPLVNLVVLSIVVMATMVRIKQRLSAIFKRSQA